MLSNLVKNTQLVNKPGTHSSAHTPHHVAMLPGTRAWRKHIPGAISSRTYMVMGNRLLAWELVRIRVASLCLMTSAPHQCKASGQNLWSSLGLSLVAERYCCLCRSYILPKSYHPFTCSPLECDSSKEFSWPSVSPSSPAILLGTQSSQAMFCTNPIKTPPWRSPMIFTNWPTVNSGSWLNPSVAFDTHDNSLLCEGQHSLLVLLSLFWSLELHLTPLMASLHLCQLPKVGVPRGSFFSMS